MSRSGIAPADIPSPVYSVVLRTRQMRISDTSGNVFFSSVECKRRKKQLMKHGEPCLFLVAVLMGLSSDYGPAGLRGPECILRTPKSNLSKVRSINPLVFYYY